MINLKQVFFTLVIMLVTPVLGHATGTLEIQSAAIANLELAKQMLRAHLHDGGALGARTILNFINRAEEEGVLNQPVTHIMKEDVWKEVYFGSPGRVYGEIIPQTRIFLSSAIYVPRNPSHKSFASIHVILPSSIDAHGYIGRELNVTFTVDPKNQEIKVTFKNGTDDIISGDLLYQYETELKAQFFLDSAPHKSWASVDFETKRTGNVNLVHASSMLRGPCEKLLRD